MIRALSMTLLVAGSAIGQVVGAPTVGVTKRWSAPVPQVGPLSNGSKLWVHTTTGVPLVHAVVLVSAGALTDPAGKAGLAALTASLIEEGGAGARSPSEVIDAFDALGSTLHTNAGEESVSFSFAVLSSKVDQALPLMFEVLTKPRFDDKAFASLKQRRLAEISAELDEPRAVANMVMGAALYGTGPRAHAPHGTLESVKGLSLDDVKAFYSANYAPSQVTVVLVGDITLAGAQKIINTAVGKPWSSVAAQPAVVQGPATPASWVAIDKPGAAQTVVVFAKPGPAANAPTLMALREATVVLGGSFTSRLNQRLREKSGYTYGVGARVSPGREAGELSIHTSVKTDVTAPALVQLIEELKGIGTLTASEQQKARALLDAELVESFGSGSSAAFSFSQVAGLGLPPNELSVASGKLAAVTLEQVTEATKAFAPESYTVVLVGDRARIEKPVKQAFPNQVITWRAAP